MNVDDNPFGDILREAGVVTGGRGQASHSQSSSSGTGGGGPTSSPGYSIAEELVTAWRVEANCPEMLSYKVDLVDRVSGALSHMQVPLKLFSPNGPLNLIVVVSGRES
jgi:hypothetical protein